MEVMGEKEKKTVAFDEFIKRTLGGDVALLKQHQQSIQRASIETRIREKEKEKEKEEEEWQRNMARLIAYPPPPPPDSYRISECVVCGKSEPISTSGACFPCMQKLISEHVKKVREARMKDAKKEKEEAILGEYDKA